MFQRLISGDAVSGRIFSCRVDWINMREPADERLELRKAYTCFLFEKDWPVADPAYARFE